jgi:hypothetical protein
MFFVLEDDDCVHVYASPDDVVQSIEGLDAEECIRSAFDDQGRPHRVEWLEPNQYGRSPFGFQSVGSGRYTLVPSGSPDPAALMRLLQRDRPVFAGQTVVALDEVLAGLRKLNAGI